MDLAVDQRGLVLSESPFTWHLWALILVMPTAPNSVSVAQYQSILDPLIPSGPNKTGLEAQKANERERT